MKAKHLHQGMICHCGQVFTKQTTEGRWYWCLWCDAHAVSCKRRGDKQSPRCGCLT